MYIYIVIGLAIFSIVTYCWVTIGFNQNRKNLIRKIENERNKLINNL